MGVKQGALTVIVRIAPGRDDALRELLDGIGDAVEDSDLVPFPQFETLHFGRWFVLPEQRSALDDTVFPAQLVLSTNYDGELDDHLAELIGMARTGVDVIYEHCVGYPDAQQRTPHTIAAYLKAHAVDHAIFYVGAPGLDVMRIRQEARLRDGIEAFLDMKERETDRWAGWTPARIRDAVREAMRGRSDMRWAFESPGPAVRTLPWYGWMALTLIAVLILPLVVVGVILVRLQELGDDSGAVGDDTTPVPEPVLSAQQGADRQVRTVTAREDYQVQNQLSHVVEIKPGWIRRIALRAVLPVLDFGARYIYNQGSLFGVSTLHFVRWVVIDGGRRLMFLTNYDGSMISYVGDFVNKSWQIPSALTAIWSNTIGFPRTRWLLFGGARDIRRFTAFLRDHQVPTQTWYSAYKRLTTGNIVNNAQIRRGLIAPLDTDRTVRWLRRL
jgi:hypothetical protein